MVYPGHLRTTTKRISNTVFGRRLNFDDVLQLKINLSVISYFKYTISISVKTTTIRTI